MATNTMVALQTITASGSASQVTFTSIPQGYTDLYVVCNVGYASLGANTGYLQYRVGNGSLDTATNYSYTYLKGDGTSATSGRGPGAPYINIFASVTGTNRVIFNTSFQNYSNTTTYKTAITRTNESIDTYASVALWRSTAAINTLQVYDFSGYNFSSDSTFTLYGIAAQPVATAKATGGTITYAADGYTYHAFTSSGTFTPSQALSCDVLVVAGGGGAGSRGGGGGGAGGLIGLSAQALTSGTGYTVTIGSGGSGETQSSTGGQGAAGSNSVFGSLATAIGGGAGGGEGASGSAGGSSGGSGSGGPTSTGSPTSGQGTSGGWYVSGTGGGGGGGGAVTVGGNVTSSTNGGAGGNGSSAYSAFGIATGLGQNVAGTAYFAGGGGGGYQGTSTTNTAGLGGGGAGNYNSATATGSAGTANTGGGGGGGGAAAGTGYAGGNGGSGVVIIRYAS